MPGKKKRRSLGLGGTNKQKMGIQRQRRTFELGQVQEACGVQSAQGGDGAGGQGAKTGAGRSAFNVKAGPGSGSGSGTAKKRRVYGLGGARF